MCSMRVTIYFDTFSSVIIHWYEMRERQELREMEQKEREEEEDMIWV